MRALGAALALCAATLAAPAQTDTFEDAMAQALSDAGAAQSLIRCTALFRAFRLYAGDDTELGATAALRETDLAVTGVVIWQRDPERDGGIDDLEAAFDAIVPMVGDATELYLARMRGNHEAGGSIFDDGLDSELTYCNTLHREIEARSEG